MPTLLESVIAAHGGQERWDQFTTLTARYQVGGPFWLSKGQPGLLGDELVVADTRSEKIRFTRQDEQQAGRVIEFDNDVLRVQVTDASGGLIAEWRDPRASFLGLDSNSRWDVPQTAYFISYATWHYLTEPFLFAYPGVQTSEIEPWAEDGQTWRVLRVTYPENIATHNPTELYYFDSNFMQRRMDYQPEVNGFSPTAHYQYAEQVFDGIVIPTQRRIHHRRADRTADRSIAYITLDLSDVKFS